MPQRNLDRIRELLLIAEATEAEDDLHVGFIDIESKLTSGDDYQLTLMRDAGWIEGRDAALGNFRFTNSGHDFLDAVRDDGIWKKTKQKLLPVGGSATLEIVKGVAVELIKAVVLGGGGAK